MSASLTLPSSELAKLSAAMRTLVAATGRNGEEITRAFAARILKRWAGRTKMATQDKATVRARMRAARDLGLNKFNGQNADIKIGVGRKVGNPARAIWRTRNGKLQTLAEIEADGRVVFAPRRVPAEVWAALVASVNAYRHAAPIAIRAGIRAIGLAQQSVVQIANQLGLALASVPGEGISAAALAKVNAAIASTGVRYQNGTGHQLNANGRMVITLQNTLPKNVRMGMEITLERVIAGEVKYYEKNMEHGVFLSAAQTARAYPFLRAAA